MYAKEAWFVHDLLTVTPELITATTDTTKLGPMVDAQRPWPGHPKHLPGAVAIQITGTLGILHAVYGLNKRSTEGWVGFGTHIHTATFKGMGIIGPPVNLRGEITRVRPIRSTLFIDYTFSFTQEDRLLYVSKQTAAWQQGDHRGPCPDIA